LFRQLFVDPLVALLVWLTEQISTLPLPGWLSAYGLALVAIAILVKTVTYPLTAAQMRSMRSMQELQPRMKQLQKQYKDDRETLAKKQMELYQEHGVNPFGGCLPLIIQLPVLWGLFQAITTMGGDPAFQKFVARPFLWVADLSVREPLPTDPDPGLPLMIILMAASQFAYQKFMTPPTQADGDAQAEAMRSVMQYSPILFAFIFIKFPAGVVLYYTTFNLVSVVQQWFLNRESGLQGLTLPVEGSDDEPRHDEGPPDSGPMERKSDESTVRRRRRKKIGRSSG
jgi:YidC/Oxa1 family membrane protein insertase